MSTDKKPFNPRHRGTFNQEIQPTFNEVTEQDRQEAAQRLADLEQRTRESLEESQ